MRRSMAFGRAQIAAIDQQRRPSNAKRIITTKKQRGVGNVLRNKWYAHRHTRQSFAQQAFGVGRGVKVMSQHRRVSNTRAKAITTQAKLPIIEGHSAS